MKLDLRNVRILQNFSFSFSVIVKISYLTLLHHIYGYCIETQDEKSFGSSPFFVKMIHGEVKRRDITGV